MGACKDGHYVLAKLIWNRGFNRDFTWRAECQDQQQWWVRRHELAGCLQGGSAQVGGRWRGADGALSRVVGEQAGRGGQDWAGKGRWGGLRQGDPGMPISLRGGQGMVRV